MKRVVHLYQQKYQGFGPTLFSEKLAEIEGIHISDETTRIDLDATLCIKTTRTVRTLCREYP